MVCTCTWKRDRRTKLKHEGGNRSYSTVFTRHRLCSCFFLSVWLSGTPSDWLYDHLMVIDFLSIWMPVCLTNWFLTSSGCLFDWLTAFCLSEYFSVRQQLFVFRYYFLKVLINNFFFQLSETDGFSSQEVKSIYTKTALSSLDAQSPWWLMSYRRYFASKPLF